MTLERAALLAAVRKGQCCSLLRNVADFLTQIGERRFGDVRDKEIASHLSSKVDDMATTLVDELADHAIEREAMRQAIKAHPNADRMRDILTEALGNA